MYVAAWNSSQSLDTFWPIFRIWPSNMLGQICRIFPMSKPFIVYNNVWMADQFLILNARHEHHFYDFKNAHYEIWYHICKIKTLEGEFCDGLLCRERRHFSDFVALEQKQLSCVDISKEVALNSCVLNRMYHLTTVK